MHVVNYALTRLLRFCRLVRTPDGGSNFKATNQEANRTLEGFSAHIGWSLHKSHKLSAAF